MVTGNKPARLLYSAVLAAVIACGCSGNSGTTGNASSSSAAPAGSNPPAAQNNGDQTSGPVDVPGTVTTEVSPPATPLLKLSVASVTSGSVSISWQPVAGASATNIYIAPEPAANDGGQMPAEVKETTVAGDANAYTINRLSASVDVFIRIEAVAPGGNVSEQIHARTLGGPRAALDNALREAHGFAPNVLQIVLANGDGAAWQSGTWTVKRRDGSAIGVDKVWRHSIPVSADDYTPTESDPHFYNINSDKVTAVDHRIYLVLDKPIGSPEMLSITGPSGIDFRLPFSDRYLETPVVQLNQVGYNPRASKRWAYVSGWMGDGGGLSLANFPGTAEMLKENGDVRELVQGGLALNERAKGDSDAGADVDDIDISQVPAAADVYYRVRIPGVGVSWRTQINERAAFQAFYVVMRGLFFNRWGGDLRSDLTNWSRPPDHGTVSTTNVGTMPDRMFCSKDTTLHVLYNCDPQPYPGDNGTPIYPMVKNDRALAGGYHDAGDFDQRPTHTVVPQLLLRAYELNPSLYKDGQLNIPESGNGIPDLLDEALWGVAAWEQLQETDGGVRAGVESYRHPLYSHANYNTDPYWTFAENANISARAAGVFAQASRLLAPFDSAKAGDLKQRAINAYNYAKANGASDYFLFYPAGELYKLTGTLGYRDDFESYWKAKTGMYNLPSYAAFHLQMSDYINVEPGSGAMPDYFMAYFTSGGPFTDFGTLYGTGDSVWKSKTVATMLASGLKSDADKWADATINSTHAHRNPRGSYPVDWGYGVSVNRFLDTLVAVLQMGIGSDADQQKYFDCLSLAADYTLGGNPNGMAYITGLGSRHPMEPLHTDSLIFIKEGKGAMPGIPAYGPIADPGAADYILPTLAAFYPAFAVQPLALHYADVRPFVKGSEFSVWEMQAPLAELFSILLGPNMMP